MAGKALYLGPRLKRLRRDLGLTQANMASDLDISPSYVALMERNQRPVTAELLLKLAKTYAVDIASLADDDADEVNQRLQAVLKEPIFADIDLPPLDIADIANSYPGFAEALLRLHTAYSEEQLELANRRILPTTGDGENSRSDPVSEARAFLAARRNAFPTLDDRAEELAEIASDVSTLVEHLENNHRLSVRFVDPQVIMGAVRWLDQHRMRLMLSERLDRAGKRFQLASQLALMEARDEIDRLVGEGRFSSDNAKRLAVRALVAHFAAATLMPYRAFSRAAQKCQYDMELLCREFGVSFEQAAHRLTNLTRPGGDDISFAFIRIDKAGNVSKRLDGADFPFARFGGACPLWTIHDCFQHPRQILTQWLELENGQRFFSIARSVSAGGGSYGAPRVQRAVALVCSADQAGKLAYAQGDAGEPTPVGEACHLCHRPHCIARAAPPIGRDMRPDDYRETGIPFAFAAD